MTINKLPTVLAFDRKLEPSDGVMFSGNWSDRNKEESWRPIKLFDRRNRAVKSNFTQEVLENEEELQKKMAEANLSWGDDASLGYGQDTLCLSFSLRVVSGIESPTVCNNTDFEARFNEVISGYLHNDVEELAHRYAYNIANGRFLWRNRIDAEQVEVRVTGNGLSERLEFNAYDFALAQTKSDDEKVKQLAQVILAGLKGDSSTILKIEAYTQLGEAQRVWPSQEMVLNTPKGEKSRHLFSLDDIAGVDSVAAMHSEKIGNALRTIDDWYPQYKETQSPIAIEAYGSVTQKGVAYRSSRNDFVSLLKQWLSAETSEKINVEDKHFVVAMLIRGGVFGEGES